MNNTIRFGFAITIGLLGIVSMLFGVIFGNFWQAIAGVWMMIVGSDAFTKNKEEKNSSEAMAEVSLLDLRLRALERELNEKTTKTGRK